MKAIKYNKQYIDENDKKNVLNALAEEKITTGKQIIKFENNLRKYLGSKFVSCVNSGTSAIYIAIKSLNLKKNDIVIMPSINFIASYNCAINLGLKIYLSDVDPKTGQSRPKDVEDTIKRNKLKKVDLVISMYLGGQPDNVVEYYKLKKKYKFLLMEDACHALGGSYEFNNKKYKVGCSNHCDISTFSLHPLKTITSGEGGVISTNSKLIYKKINLLKSHGILRKKKYWNYEVIMNGYNYRMSDILASLGKSQLKKLKLFTNFRNKIFNSYKKILMKYDISFQKVDKNDYSSFHLVIILFKNKSIRDKVFTGMRQNKFFLNLHYIPIYRHPYYQNKKFSISNFPNAEYYYERALSIPVYYGLENKDLLKFEKVLKKILS